MSATPTPPPQVTVLMPVRNGAAHLLESIRSVLAQTFQDFELLVIDDGSTDETPKILQEIRDSRLRVITHPQNVGLVPTLNEGLRLARGEWIARQDHDDLSALSRLQRQVEYLRAHSDCVLVGGQALQIGEDGRPALPLFRPPETETIRWYLCFDNAFIHSAVMFRRNIIRDEFGGYPMSLHSEDYALWSRVARERHTANLPEPLLYYREYGGSVTGSLKDESATVFDEATAAIRQENLRDLFGDGETAAEDARILSTYRRPFTPASAQAFLAVFERLRARYLPRVQKRDEFRWVCGIQLAELAYRLLPLARGPAIGIYRRALVTAPFLVFKLPWWQLLALLVLGKNARRLYQRIFRKV